MYLLLFFLRLSTYILPHLPFSSPLVGVVAVLDNDDADDYHNHDDRTEQIVDDTLNMYTCIRNYGKTKKTGAIATI